MQNSKYAPAPLWQNRSTIVTIFFITQLALTSCATTGSDKNLFFPDGERLKEAAIGALVDPYTWAPALGAGWYPHDSYNTVLTFHI